MKELKNVKRDELFRLSTSENAPLWVRGEYDRAEKKYECYKYDDINHFSYFKGTRNVFVE